MNINIDVEDINKINSRKIHQLTMTQESITTSQTFTIKTRKCIFMSKRLQ